MKIGVTGFRGKLGSSLVRMGCEPLDCDVTILDSVMGAIDMVRPDVIIHCAAKGNNKVDWCETADGEKVAYAVNARGTAHVRWSFSGPMILVSTSYIFDGKHGPYGEKVRGVPNPVNAYGFTKLAAECLFMDEGPGTIVRTVGLFGGNGDDFAKTIIAQLSAGDPVNALVNLSFNPTYVPYLAEWLVQLAKMKNPPKVLNLAGSKVQSRYEFALAVAEVFGLDKKLVIPTRKVENWIAPRPRAAGLRIDLMKKLGFQLHDVIDGLTEMRELMYART